MEDPLSIKASVSTQFVGDLMYIGIILYIVFFWVLDAV